MTIVQQPELAMAGWRLVRDSYDEFREGERYVRDKVLARANPALTADAISNDPVEAVFEAGRAHKNLLYAGEVLATKNWARSVPEETVRDALMDLLHGVEDLKTRAERFFEVAGRRKGEDGHVLGFNATAASYFLCMADPERHAFLKPASTFNPAVTLLCRRGGDPTIQIARAERIELGTRLYSELRELWSLEGFEGDLLDVHTVLYVLGCRGYEHHTWADACSTDASLLARLARQWQDQHEDWAVPVHAASELMRTHLVDADKPNEMLHRVDLRTYAYGTGRPVSFCSAVEHLTTAWVQTAQGNASPHEVGIAGDGTWRLSTKTGHTEAEAQQRFEQSVLPRLEELAEAARAWLKRAPMPTLTAVKLQHYRSLDAKTFMLLIAALDPERAAQEVVSVVSLDVLYRIGFSLGDDDEYPWSMQGYLSRQSRLREILETLPNEIRPSGTALAGFWFGDPSGRLLNTMFEEQEEEDEHQDEGEGEAEAPAQTTDKQTAPTDLEDREPWAAFLEALSPDLAELGALLRDRKNVVLYGPPGTGKTWLASRLARAWLRFHGEQPDSEQSETVVQVTFHPSYGYEEFIEAWRPDLDRPGAFHLVNGPLPTLAERAIANPKKLYLLFIDELNRGDVARILGELITLLEADKRKPSFGRLRMLSGERLWLPENLYVLGTMNTADKSISLMDVAIRRRFAFRLTPPLPHVLTQKHGVVEALGGVRLADLLTGLNQRLLAIGVPPDRMVGHAVLRLAPDSPLEALADRLRYDIVPLIEEYCFSDRQLVKRVLGDLVDERGLPVEEIIGDEDRLVEALAWIAHGPGE